MAKRKSKATEVAEVELGVVDEVSAADVITASDAENSTEAKITVIYGNYLWLDVEGFGYQTNIHAVEPWMQAGKTVIVYHSGKAGSADFKIKAVTEK